MENLRDKMTFLTEKFVPVSIECVNCNCRCSGSVYSLDEKDREICMYIPEISYSILSYIILKDSYVNYNHFLLARVFGIDIGLGATFEMMEGMKKYVSETKIESKEIEEYKKLISDYDTALAIPSEKIRNLKNKYNVDNPDLYFSTINHFDNSFTFDSDYSYMFI